MTEPAQARDQRRGDRRDGRQPDLRERHTRDRAKHRATDRAVPGISSTSPLQTRYVPVGKMYFEGLSRLVAADIELPGLRQSQAETSPTTAPRLGFEAYPGLLATEVLGKQSYKSDDKTKQTPERLIARKDLVTALEHGQTRLGLRLKLTHAQRDKIVDDPRGDALDAVLCLIQAAWAQTQGAPLYGLPEAMDPLEGWIVTA